MTIQRTAHVIEGADMSGTFSVSDLDLDKTVTGSDGNKIGVVSEVVKDPSASPGSPASFYFEVDCGGFLGIGGNPSLL
jgi:hypothetical protein